MDIDFLSAVRLGDWKLVYRIAQGSLELYNLKEDIGETVNVADSHPEITRQLAVTLSDSLRAWHSPMPVVVQTGLPAPYPDEI